MQQLNTSAGCQPVQPLGASEVQRGILVRTKPTYFAERGCMERFMTQNLELFVKKKKKKGHLCS